MSATCTIEGCDKPEHARGLCGRHYDRNRRNGDPVANHRRPANRLKWLTEAIANPGDECIDWPFASMTRGYGYLSIAGGPKVYAHRVSCSERYGPPPTLAHEAAHNCGRRSCVNPNHLRWATRRENHSDMIEHGTMNYENDVGLTKHKQRNTFLGIGMSEELREACMALADLESFIADWFNAPEPP